MSTNHNPIDKITKCDVADSRKERKFAYWYHHWKANKKIMDIINEQDKSPETLRLLGKRQEMRKSSLKLSVTGREVRGSPDDRTKEEVMRWRKWIWN